ncbi:hypothetical protein CW748_15940, partial [Alteromonadales bacterium alter-6D02]
CEKEARPSVAISDDTTGTATGDVLYTFTFSEDMTGFTVDDIVLTGGSKGIFTEVSATEYTLVVTPNSDSTTDLTVNVAADVAIDAAGNNNTVAVESTQAVDTVIPSVAISDDTTGTATGDVLYTFTFSEDMTGFSADDVVLTGGVKGTFTAVSATAYTLVVTPNSDSTTELTVNVAANVAIDAAGNNNTVATESTQAVDTVIPSVAISDNITGTATGDVVYTFTFSEAMTGFSADDIVLTGGSKGTFTAVSATEYTLVVTPAADSTTAMTVNVAVGVAIDAAGNNNTVATESTQAVDTVIPSVAISDDTTGTATGDVVYTFTFSEAMTGFTADDVVLTGGVKGTFTAVSATEYTLVVTPNSDSTTDLTVNVAAGVAIDAAGNNNTVATESTQAVDTVIPSVAITDNEPATATDDVVYTFTFNEAMTGFSADDIVLTGGSKGTFTAISATEYTLVVTPNANSTTDLTVNVAADVAIDAAGNNNLAATESVQAVDTVIPTVSITDNEAETATGEVVYTFTFSEAMTGFTAADVVLTGGIKGTFTAVSATEYTLVVTPNSDSTTDLTVNVAANVATDAAGNNNTVATESTQAVDTVIPTVAISDDTTGTATGDVVYTFTFSEAMTGFTADDVVLTGGVKGIFTEVSATEYTLVVTPNSDSTTDLTVNVAAGVAIDAAGNNNTVATESTQAVDTVIPSVAISDDTTGTATGDVVYTFTFSEAMTGFTADDVVLTGGVKGTFTAVSATEYTLVVTPNSDSTTDLTVNVAADVAIDAAGNNNTAATESTQAVDTIIPVITNVAIADTSMKVGDVVTVTLTVEDDAGDIYSNLTGTVGGFALSNLVRVDNTTYTAQFTVTEGGTDVAAGDSIPTSITIDDTAGNSSQAYTTAIFVGSNDSIDANTPSVATINVVALDDVINHAEDSSVVITGTGEPGAMITLSLKDHDYTLMDGNTAVVAPNGTWSLPVNNLDIVLGLGEGAKTLSVIQTDAAGNISAPSIDKVITVDTKASAPVINNVTADSVIIASEATDGFVITGTAEAGATVTLVLGSGHTLAGGNTAVADQDGNWSVAVNAADVTAMGQGSETVTATQVDVAGNTSLVSSVKTFNVDTQVGAPTIAAIAVGPVVTAAEATAGFNITGTGEAGSTITLSTGQTATVDNLGNWSVAIDAAAVTAMGEGLQSITATQADTVGNVSVASNAEAITVKTTVAAPVVNTVAVDDVINYAEANNNVTISGTGEVGATVTLDFDENIIYNFSFKAWSDQIDTVVDNSGNWSVTLTSQNIQRMGEGIESIIATQTDIHGNVSAAAETKNITVDIVVDAPTIDALSVGAVLNADEATAGFNITGKGDVGATITLILDSGTTLAGGNTATVDADGNWSIAVTAADAVLMAQGNESITATQTDQYNNVSVPSAAKVVDVDTVNDAPTFTLATDSGVLNSDNLTNIATVNVSLAADVASWEYSLDSGVTWLAGSGASFDLANDSIYSAGAIKVRQTDDAGNISDITSSAALITTDMIAPAKPSFTLPADSGKSASDAITNLLTVTVALAAEQVTWQYSLDAGTTWVDGTGTSFDLAGDTAYAIGDIQVKQTDKAGNTSEAVSNTAAITTDVTAAAAGIALANDLGVNITDGITNDSTVSVTLAADVDSWQYSLNGGATWSTGVGTSFELANNTTYTAGQVQVKQTDIAGNESVAASNASTFKTDQVVSTVGLSLANDTGRSSSDEKTNDATVNVSLAADVASWEYRLNNGAWVTGTGTSFELADDTTYGVGAIDVRQTDIAGNVSAISSFNETVTTDMTVGAPAIALYHDSGSSNSDSITNHTYLRVTKESSNSTYIYSLDGGDNWSSSTSSTYIQLTANSTYAIGDIQVIQTDEAGNVSAATSNTSVIQHDNIAGTPVIGLAADSGTLSNDFITNDRTVNVTLTSDVSSWIYSLNGGANWINGTGTSFELAADQVYTAGVIQIQQTDIAGNVSNVVRSSDTFITDSTAIKVDSFTSTSFDDNYREGANISITATMSEVVTSGMAFDVTLDNGQTVTLTAAADGLTLAGTYVVAAGDNSSDLNVASITNTSVTDTAGNALATDLPSGNNLADNSNFVVDTSAPTNTFTGATYDAATNTLVLTGTNINSLLSAGETSSTNLKNNFDWTKFQWDIDTDNTDNMVGLAEMFNTAVVTDDNTLTITLSHFGALALEATAGFDPLTVDDSIEISAGFSGDSAGNKATTDAFDSGLDVTSPVITDVSVPDASMKVGSVVTVTLTVEDDAGDTYHNVNGTVGGFTLSNLQRVNSTTYTAQFTVTEGGTDVAAGASIPTSITIDDSANNTSAQYTTAISSGASDSIDANTPNAPTINVVATDDTIDNAEATAGVTITGTGEIGATVTLTFDSGHTLAGGNTAVVDGSGNWSVAANAADVTAMGQGNESITATQADAAGNTSVASSAKVVNVDTIAAVETSVVVFDLVEGVSSDHSSRSFDANTSYTIYIKVDSNSHVLSSDGISSNPSASWGTWTGANNLGADDKIVLVGSGSAVIGAGPVITHWKSPTFIAWSPAAGLRSHGLFSRYDGMGSNQLDLWTGTWSINPNTDDALGEVYLTAMLNGVLTSQGLA